MGRSGNRRAAQPGYLWAMARRRVLHAVGDASRWAGRFSYGIHIHLQNQTAAQASAISMRGG